MAKHYIKAWRKFRGLTLREFAERMDLEEGERFISQVSLSRIERGIQPYSEIILDRMAYALGVTPVMLLGADPYGDGRTIDLVRRIGELETTKKETILAMLAATVGDADLKFDN